MLTHCKSAQNDDGNNNNNNNNNNSIHANLFRLMSILIDIFVNRIGLTAGGSSTVHIYTQSVHRTTQQLWLESFLGFEPRVVKLRFTILSEQLYLYFYIIFIFLYFTSNQKEYNL
jgi:hypothetical protein